MAPLKPIFPSYRELELLVLANTSLQMIFRPLSLLVQGRVLPKTNIRLSKMSRVGSSQDKASMFQTIFSLGFACKITLALLLFSISTPFMSSAEGAHKQRECNAPLIHLLERLSHLYHMLAGGPLTTTNNKP